MPAPDRLSELLHQRALLQEHLVWLEREIAAASGPAGPNYPAEATTRLVSASAPSPAAVPSWPMPTVTDPASTTAKVTAAEEIIDQYRVAPDTLKTDLRQGCLLYFLGALGLVALGIVGLYFLFQRGR